MPIVDETTPLRKRHKRVQASTLPLPPTPVWVLLGVLIAFWGLRAMRPERTSTEPFTEGSASQAASNANLAMTEANAQPEQQAEEQPNLSAQPTATVTAETEPPVLESITSVTQVTSPAPPADAGVNSRPILTTNASAENVQPESYTVVPGDTMGNIAAHFDVPVEELMSVNGMADPNLIYVGQVLILPTVVELAAPYQRLLPDSELVLSPVYADFNARAFITQKGGYLASHREEVEGEELSGPEIVELVSTRYSVGPRPLLAMLEYQSGWLTRRDPEERKYPLGLEDPLRSGLFFQLSWAANRMNEGYYNKYTRRDLTLRFKDGTRALLDSDTNPGTAAIQNAFAANMDPEAWSTALAADGFLATYIDLFGEPFARTIEPLIPADLKQPELRLPWSSGETWYYTGGPHGGWGDLSGWAALDFVPADNTGCADSSFWATSATRGRVIRSENGEVVVDLDGDGFGGTGWTVLYMHMGSAGRVPVGTQVKVGDRIGHPSCEGGFSDAAHLHIARRYNGQWIDADGSVPFVLGGWQAQNGASTYNGYLVRGSESREACICRTDEINGIKAP